MVIAESICVAKMQTNSAKNSAANAMVCARLTIYRFFSIEWKLGEFDGRDEMERKTHEFI